MSRVSVIIPGRCEPYFQETVDSVLDSATGDVEVIAVIDGPGQEPPVIKKDDRVKIVELEKSIGQRAAYNIGVKHSTGKYVMKIDAHALLSKGFDEELKSHCTEKMVVLPEMRRLDVYKWEDKPTGRTHFMFFGLDLYCHYWKDYKNRPEAQVEYPEVMTGQGSCWFTTREWNDHIGLLDEGVGSWGNVGIEVSLRTWLCGGSQILNKNAWQAHWFRKDEGGFTYPMDGRKVAKAHRYTFNNYYFKDDAFERQCRPFSWLIEKFNPIPSWEAYSADYYKAPRVIVYYTDSKLDETNPVLANAVRKHLKKVAGPIPIISVSQKKLNFGKNLKINPLPRKYKSVYQSLLAGVEFAPDNSIVYLCEHDVFYHPSHFAKLPENKDTMYFDTNRYYYMKGLDTYYKARGKRALSQSVGYREAIIKHAEERLKDCGDDITERWKELEKRSQVKYETFTSDRPNVDILHDLNFTPRGIYKNDYIKKRKKGISNLPGWGRPPHFQSKTGYKDPMPKEPAEYVRAKFKKWLPQVSPIRIPKLKRIHLAKLYKDLKYKVGAEIGVREGKFSLNFCIRIPKVTLFCIDLWEELDRKYGKVSDDKARAYFERAQERLIKYDAHFIKKSSMDAVKDFDDESLDFVYIDANHEFDFVMQDLIEWSKKVRKGGMVSGHDYYRTRGMGVVPAVDAYTYAHDIREWYITDEKEASFFWVKP